MNERLSLTLSAGIRLDCIFSADTIRAVIVAGAAEARLPGDETILATITGKTSTASLFHERLQIGRACFFVPHAAHADAIAIINRAQAAG